MRTVLLFVLVVVAYAAQLQVQGTPMARVAELLIEMRAKIESDGKKEQMDYDKYACWCEEMVGRKVADMSQAKEWSERLQEQIMELGGQLGSHAMEIKQLEKDIATTRESIRGAAAVREKENAGYESGKTESEQCIGALEGAIKGLTGAGTGSFLETMQEVQILSVASGIRAALQNPSITESMSPSDLTLVHKFVERPADFLGKRAGSGMSAVQIAQNPLGDFAPQSTQIQGILQGMYEAFKRDLESDKAAEADAHKAFEGLMQTKRQELQTLEAALASQKRDAARASHDRDISREELDDTNAQVNADVKFFESTKAGCKEKAQQWSIRSRLRSQELAGVNMAVGIMTSDKARKIFTRSTVTFVQLGAATQSASGAQLAARAQLARLARKYHSLSLAKVALDVQSGGHLDKIIATIDQMIASLRAEEQEDAEHRDRCQRAGAKNSNDMEDLSQGIEKAGTKIESLLEQARSLSNEITALEGHIEETKHDMKQALKLRNEEVAHFAQAVKDDEAAIALLDQTIITLSEFYRKNGISLTFSQIRQDQAPQEETNWSDEGGHYGGQSGETHSIVVVLGTLKENVQKEMKTSRDDDSAAEAQYEKERADLGNSLNAQLATKRATERQLGEVQAAMQDKIKSKLAQEEDLEGDIQLKSALQNDCAWAGSHFESRRKKRKAEIDGLVDAKGYLAGAEDGSLI